MEIPRSRNQNVDHDIHYRRKALFTISDGSPVESWEFVLGENTNKKYYDPMHLSLDPLNNTSSNCSLCNVDWELDHASLDCHECGGYSMSRPCVTCDGKCESIWKRDLVASHMKNKAIWTGKCHWNNNKNNNNRCSSNKNTNEQNLDSSKSPEIEEQGGLQMYF